MLSVEQIQNNTDLNLNLKAKQLKIRNKKYFGTSMVKSEINLEYY